AAVHADQAILGVVGVGVGAVVEQVPIGIVGVAVHAVVSAVERGPSRPTVAVAVEGIARAAGIAGRDQLVEVVHGEGVGAVHAVGRSQQRAVGRVTDAAEAVGGAVGDCGRAPAGVPSAGLGHAVAERVEQNIGARLIALVGGKNPATNFQSQVVM